ncbi:MAG: hypothetical protein ACLQD8_02035 [Thermoplasmata archaeon]
MSASAGVGVAALLVLGFGPPGPWIPLVTTCSLGEPIGTYTIWTPSALVNVPDGGAARLGENQLNWTVSSGSLTVGQLAPPGPGGEGMGWSHQVGIVSEFNDESWTFYRTHNVSTRGGGAGPCTQPYVAEISGPGYGCGEAGAVLPLIDNSSDVVEPHVWNGTPGDNGSTGFPGCPTATPGAYVWFDSSFHSSGPGWNGPFDLNLCRFSGLYNISTRVPAKLPIVVHVPYQDGAITASGLLTWNNTAPSPAVGPAAGYSLPSGWLWEIAPVGPVHSSLAQYLLTPGLLAFERKGC